MVSQRRISISPYARGIRKWELVLLIWWNYLYQWLKFQWKITSQSKFQKIEIRRRSDLPRSTDLHNWNGKRKTGAIGVIIISGSLGTLKDRWNFWTFGIKVYNHNQIISFRNKQNIYLSIKRLCCDSYIAFTSLVVRKYIISGSRGTHKDRWNFWTFGSKVFRTKTIIYRLKYSLNSKVYKPCQLLVNSIITVINSRSKWRGIKQRKGITSLFTTLISTDNTNCPKPKYQHAYQATWVIVHTLFQLRQAQTYW
jgi:hypothetical protein